MDLKLNFKHLTDANYGRPKEKQNQLLQDLIRPHIESFNCILYEGFPKMLENIEPVQFALPNGDRIALTIQDIILSSPKVHEKAASSKTLKVYPAECRGRGTTYGGALQIQIGYSVNGSEGPQISRNLGNIPMMVKSDLCNLAKLSPAELINHGEEAEEMGGYFIINGIERVVRMLILPRRNYPLCVIRSTWKNRGSLYSEYGIMVRCVRSDHTALNMTLHYLNNGSADLCFFFNREIFYAPIAIILKGLLDLSDTYIYNELVKGKEDDTFYKGCIKGMMTQLANENLLTRQDVLRYIGSTFRIRLNYFIPEWYTDEEAGRCLYKLCICVHLTSDADKFNFLVFATRKLFDFAMGKCAEESGDNIMFQEVLLGGHLYQMILKEKLQGYVYQLKSIIERQARSHKSGPDLYRVTADSISHALHYCPELAKSVEYFFSTGNLVSYSGLGLLQESGMTVVADKLNFMRYMSHFRCIHRGAFFAEMRTTTVRKLLPEAWGFLCPVHTPDGSPCGLMNHATTSCQFQVFTCPQQPLIKALFSLGICALDAPFCNIKECYTVLLDGKVVGYLDDDSAQEVATRLRIMKVKGWHNIPATTEICLVKKTEYASQYPGLYIFTTPARMIRPVKNLALNMVEMIGTFEQVYMDICINQNEAYEGITTHEELSDTSILSLTANLTPFSDFNQSPRNMYQCQMVKQTMGISLHSLPFRNDNKIYRLQTPQSPLVRPAKYDDYDVDNYPLGTNAIVAVISYTGYDMEDAMVLNKGSFQRGFTHATVYKSEIIDLISIMKLHFQTTPLIFACKADSDEVKNGLLDIDGLPPIGAYLENGTPYYSYINTQSGEQKVVHYKSIESAHVEHIKVLGSDIGVRLRSKVSIMLRVNRNPVIGDKFASRHGQKGICSMMYSAENMPFTESGMTPDIIFNPHGYPSRMTIGLMIESMAGKAASSFGHCYDATPFQFSEDDSAVEYFGDLLVKAGFNYHGTEKLYSGVDGRELEASIFMGVVYYQRLRHMVSDKFQVRTTGPVDQVTFQPVKGRKKHGGVRFGEMERDALIAHGTSFLLQDRLLNCSDKSMSPICTKCGSLISVFLEKRALAHAAASYEKQRQWKCLLCKSSKDIEVIVVPYVLRYLVAELASMNIRMNLTVK